MLALAAAAAALTARPFWADGLRFSCTSCGKCCQMDGDVWLAPEEIGQISAHVGVSREAFVAENVRRRLRGWALLKPDEATGRGCTFLVDGQCSIYDKRPVQCRTYPFWPSLIDDESDWADEAVTPDGEPGRSWDLETGGCEGINAPDAPLVPAAEIAAKRAEARAHWRRFPGWRIKRDTWRL